jgi:hypothetical protein
VGFFRLVFWVFLGGFFNANPGRIIGRGSGRWLEEDMLDSWKKVWWMVERRSAGWLKRDLVDNGMRSNGMVERRSGG